jgi:hypothetical protein
VFHVRSASFFLSLSRALSPPSLSTMSTNKTELATTNKSRGTHFWSALLHYQRALASDHRDDDVSRIVFAWRCKIAMHMARALLTIPHGMNSQAYIDCVVYYLSHNLAWVRTDDDLVKLQLFTSTPATGKSTLVHHFVNMYKADDHLDIEPASLTYVPAVATCK